MGLRNGEQLPLDIGDMVEVIVAGPPSLCDLWVFDGCRGLVVGTYREKGEQMATVKVISSVQARAGKQWFPTRMLRKV
jgi:hypothetical protein